MKKLSRSILVSLFACTAMAGNAVAQPSTLAQCLSVPIIEFDGNIVEAAVATPELTTLVDAVLAAGLDEALATTEDITVYAPTNDAFAALPVDVLNTIVGDTDLLTAVLTYHVTPSKQDPRRYVEARSRKTLQGQSVYYERYDQFPHVNNAQVSCQGVRASNGLVWFLDSVLVPSL